MVAQLSELPVLHAMANDGFARTAGSKRWFLTGTGQSAMMSVRRLVNGTKVFTVRDHVAVGVNTVYELLIKLKRQGWEWQKWLPRSQRSKNSTIVDAYLKEAPKKFYSGLQPEKSYLQCLLQAEDPYALVSV